MKWGLGFGVKVCIFGVMKRSLRPCLLMILLRNSLVILGFRESLNLSYTQREIVRFTLNLFADEDDLGEEVEGF